MCPSNRPKGRERLLSLFPLKPLTSAPPIPYPRRMIGILGAGAWGTAMACVLAASPGRKVFLVPRREQQALDFQRDGENREYLPGIALPKSLVISMDLQGVLAQCSWVLLASPAKGLAAWADAISGVLKPDTLLISLCKGLEPQSKQRPGVFFQSVFPLQPYACLSGPNHAFEVAQGQPCAAVLASEQEALLQTAQTALSCPSMRIYRSNDVAGVEWGACLKNVYAIALGVCDGLGFGDNTKAALLTRCLREYVRLGVALGGQEETFYGLSGLGDFVATAFGAWSRNRSFGEALGRGSSPESLHIHGVVEGFGSAAAFQALAQQKALEAPILEALYGILYHQTSPKESVKELLRRALKVE